MRLNTTSISFKSGLTSNILQQESKICPQETARYFRNLKNKEWKAFEQTDFKDNRAMALACKFCSKIFSNFKNKIDYIQGYSMLSLTLPQNIHVFNTEDGKYIDDQCFFTNKQKLKIEDNLAPFPIGTIFIDNNFDSLEYLNDVVEDFYKLKKCSTSHFLQPIIHEWIHTIFYKLIYNYCSNHNKSYEKTLLNLQEKSFSDKEKEIIENVISKYPIETKQNAYSELFAEAWTKFICESLAKDCVTFKRNPLKLMRATPKEFQKILQKVSSIEFL